jgi:hypothetical protein
MVESAPGRKSKIKVEFDDVEYTGATLMYKRDVNVCSRPLEYRWESWGKEKVFCAIPKGLKCETRWSYFNCHGKTCHVYQQKFPLFTYKACLKNYNSCDPNHLVLP